MDRKSSRSSEDYREPDNVLQAPPPNIGWSLQQVPPPKDAPYYAMSDELGVLPCLRTEASHRGGWRCSHCHECQPDNAWIVWVPEGVRITESATSIINAARANAYNGESSGWCLACAQRLGHPTSWWRALSWTLLLVAIAFVLSYFWK